MTTIRGLSINRQKLLKELNTERYRNSNVEHKEIELKTGDIIYDGFCLGWITTVYKKYGWIKIDFGPLHDEMDIDEVEKKLKSREYKIYREIKWTEK